MKRNERTVYNRLRREVTADTINVEIPVDFSHEARQAIHELLCIEKHMYVIGINWNSIQECYCIHWESVNIEYPWAREQYIKQENTDIDTITADMEYSDWTWNGYKKPDQEPAEASQEAPAAEAEQQPTETETVTPATEPAKAADIMTEIESALDAIRAADEDVKKLDNPEHLKAKVDAINWTVRRIDWTARIGAAMDATQGAGTPRT